MRYELGCGAATAVLLLAACGQDSPATAPAPTISADPTVRVSPGTEVTGAATLRVAGSGFDPAKGIYVAFCAEPLQGEPPTPCGGGADTTGESAASAWISSNPPPYGKDLATPYGDDGSFEVDIPVAPRIGDIDCRTQVCGIATRADHTRSSDRSQDVFVPITFKETSTP